MYDPDDILTWLEENAEGMRRSRMKSLASIVSGAMGMQGSRVLALGRAMEAPAETPRSREEMLWMDAPGDEA